MKLSSYTPLSISYAITWSEPIRIGFKSSFHSGSNASFINICLARSSIVGIPNGRNLPLLLGIKTRRILDAFPSNLNLLANFNRYAKSSVAIPSTPAVTFLYCLDLQNKLQVAYFLSRATSLR